MFHNDIISQSLAILCVVTATVVWISGGDTSHFADMTLSSQPNEKATETTINTDSTVARNSRPTRTLVDYAEILERPVFSADRRPADPVAEVAIIESGTRLQHKGPETNPLYRLVGVMLYGGKRTALITSPDGRSTITLDVGDSVDGWTLRDLGRQSATLTRGSRTETIALERKSDPRLIARLEAQARQRTRAQGAKTRAQPEQKRSHSVEESDDEDNDDKDVPNDDE